MVQSMLMSRKALLASRQLFGVVTMYVSASFRMLHRISPLRVSISLRSVCSVCDWALSKWGRRTPEYPIQPTDFQKHASLEVRPSVAPDHHPAFGLVGGAVVSRSAGYRLRIVAHFLEGQCLSCLRVCFTGRLPVSMLGYEMWSIKSLL